MKIHTDSANKLINELADAIESGNYEAEWEIKSNLETLELTGRAFLHRDGSPMSFEESSRRNRENDWGPTFKERLAEIKTMGELELKVEISIIQHYPKEQGSMAELQDRMLLVRMKSRLATL